MNYTDTEIIQAFRDIWNQVKNESHNKYYNNLPEDISVEKNSDKLIRVRACDMYEAPPLSFSHLKKLSAYFGTDDINDDERHSSSGCETCDYGSSYGWTITIRFN